MVTDWTNGVLAYGNSILIVLGVILIIKGIARSPFPPAPKPQSAAALNVWQIGALVAITLGLLVSCGSAAMLLIPQIFTDRTTVSDTPDILLPLFAGGGFVALTLLFIINWRYYVRNFSAMPSKTSAERLVWIGGGLFIICMALVNSGFLPSLIKTIAPTSSTTLTLIPQIVAAVGVLMALVGGIWRLYQQDANKRATDDSQQP